jgi:hypothetical protein
MDKDNEYDIDLTKIYQDLKRKLVQNKGIYLENVFILFIIGV